MGFAKEGEVETGWQGCVLFLVIRAGKGEEETHWNWNIGHFRMVKLKKPNQN